MMTAEHVIVALAITVFVATAFSASLHVHLA